LNGGLTPTATEATASAAPTVAATATAPAVAAAAAATVTTAAATVAATVFVQIFIVGGHGAVCFWHQGLPGQAELARLVVNPDQLYFDGVALGKYVLYFVNSAVRHFGDVQ
jgi:hypothetical protein